MTPLTIHLLPQTGGRFSKKDATPSLKSSLLRASTFHSAASTNASSRLRPRSCPSKCLIHLSALELCFAMSSASLLA